MQLSAEQHAIVSAAATAEHQVEKLLQGNVGERYLVALLDEQPTSLRLAGASALSLKQYSSKVAEFFEAVLSVNFLDIDMLHATLDASSSG